MPAFLRTFFFLLYHPFAFAYDLVAAIVSLGRWKSWVLSVLPYIEGTRILEIGHGPGHLQKALLGRKLFTIGIDESAPMGRLARRNLSRFLRSSTPSSQSIDYTQTRLVRGLAQQLPFPNKAFDTLVATFPAGYIFELSTLHEAHRVLDLNGKLVILPGASILGRGLMDRFMALIFRITGQAPPNFVEVLQERSRDVFAKAGFHVQTHELDIRSSRVFILVANKSAQEAQT